MRSLQNTHINTVKISAYYILLNAFFFFFSPIFHSDRFSFLPGMQSISCAQLDEEPLESSLLEGSSQSHLQVFSAHVSLPSPS